MPSGGDVRRVLYSWKRRFEATLVVVILVQRGVQKNEEARLLKLIEVGASSLADRQSEAVSRASSIIIKGSC